MSRIFIWALTLLLSTSLHAEFKLPFGQKKTSVDVGGVTLRTDQTNSNPLFVLLKELRGEGEVALSKEQEAQLTAFFDNLVSDTPHEDVWKLFVSSCDIQTSLGAVTPHKGCSTPVPYKLVRASSVNKIAEALGGAASQLGSYIDVSQVKGFQEAIDRIKKSIPTDDEQATIQGIVLDYALKVVRAGTDVGAQQEYIARLVYDLIKTKMDFHPELEKVVLGQLVTLLKSSAHSYRSIPGMPVSPRAIRDQVYLRVIVHGVLSELAAGADAGSEGFHKAVKESFTRHAGQISRDVSGLRYAFQGPLADQLEQSVLKSVDLDLMKLGRPNSQPVIEGILSHLNWALTEGYNAAKKADSFELPSAEVLGRHKKKFTEQYKKLKQKEINALLKKLGDLDPKEVSAPGWNIATREFLRKQLGHDLLVQAMAILRAISTEEVKELNELLETLASYEESLREGAELGVVRAEELGAAALEKASQAGTDLLKKSSKAGEDLLKESSKAGQDLLKKFKGIRWK